MPSPCFTYGLTELQHLRHADARMALAIDRIGLVERRVIPDLFSALVNSIVGQQISTKAHVTIWQRMEQALAPLTPEAILALTPSQLQAFGLSFRKVGYIQGIAREALEGSLDIPALALMDDEAVCQRLMKLNGIGRWSAEMLLLFSMQRPNVLSYGDLAIRRGLCRLHHHRTLTPALFERYRRRYSPYCSVASLYLWEVASHDLNL